MPVTAFLGDKEGYAQASSYGHKVSDVKRSSSGNCSEPSAEKAREAWVFLRVFLGMQSYAGS